VEAGVGTGKGIEVGDDGNDDSADIDAGSIIAGEESEGESDGIGTAVGIFYCSEVAGAMAAGAVKDAGNANVE